MSSSMALSKRDGAFVEQKNIATKRRKKYEQETFQDHTTMTEHPPKHKDYTVGWVCAFDNEMIAACAMLDETHPNLPPSSSDTNHYTLGRMGAHNVVIVQLPSGEQEIISAAVVSTKMGFTFTSLKCILSVGVASGIPSEQNDIRLGDVVVGTPRGVIQFDWGKITESAGFIRRTEESQRPDIVLRNAVDKLKATFGREKHSISHHLSQAVEESNNLPKRFKVMPGIPDLLFETGYTHRHDSGNYPYCDACNKSSAIRRYPRDDDGPSIHYGLIASGSSIIRDSSTRNRLGMELGAVCLDTVAAGLVTNYPAMVIRGVCDYADSHSNKAFQAIAAARAAAYAKELLKSVHLPKMD
jgi:nucleoside phosphorylase